MLRRHHYRRPPRRRLPAAQWLIADEHRVWCDLWNPEGVACTCGSGVSDPEDVVNFHVSVAMHDFVEGFRP